MSAGDVIPVDVTLAIPRSEVVVRASRSGGPGGQHVNTSSTRVELQWNVARSTVLDDARRAQLISRLASRMDGEGNVRVVASDTRSQRQNRALAEERLVATVRRALVVRKRRRPTLPTRSAVEARLAAKRRRAEKKARRRSDDDE